MIADIKDLILKKKDFNNYTINEKPFQIIDQKLTFLDREYEISPKFFKLFTHGSKLKSDDLTSEESGGLLDFIKYAGGLGKDVKSNLYTNVNEIKTNQIMQEIDYSDLKNYNAETIADIEIEREEEAHTRALEGRGVYNFIFLSSNPDTLVERLEVLVG